MCEEEYVLQTLLEILKESTTLNPLVRKKKMETYFWEVGYWNVN